eukprot:g21670.t1
MQYDCESDHGMTVQIGAGKQSYQQIGNIAVIKGNNWEGICIYPLSYNWGLVPGASKTVRLLGGMRIKYTDFIPVRAREYYSWLTSSLYPIDLKPRLQQCLPAVPSWTPRSLQQHWAVRQMPDSHSHRVDVVDVGVCDAVPWT